MHAALSATPAVLTVELPEAAVIRRERPPEPLSRDMAELLGQAVAADLHRILGDAVTDAGLVVTAALYDLTEILQPGLPMTEALLEVYRGSLRGAPFEPQRLNLGSAGGRFPLPQFAPRRSPGSGPLLAIPFALVAPGPTLDPIRGRLEAQLLERSSPALETDRIVRQQFGVDPVNLSYATFHDLSALLKVQLEYAGFGPLWSLLEAALYRPDEPCVVDTDAGNRFLGRHARVRSPYLTLQDWLATAPEATVSGYEAWIREQRQYSVGLTAHGLEFVPTEPRPGVYAQDAETALSIADAAATAADGFRRETVEGTPEFTEASAITLTEQCLPSVGPFACTVLAQRADGAIAYLGHDYPLTPQALHALREEWRGRAEALGIAFQLEQPPQLQISGDPPQLMPWLDYSGRA